MAPEVALQKEYNKSVDVWSLGIIVFTMFTMGKHPFWDSVGETRESFFQKLRNPQWTHWPPNIGTSACSFITKTATRNPENRMTAE